jgi:hypothetical protein
LGTEGGCSQFNKHEQIINDDKITRSYSYRSGSGKKSAKHNRPVGLSLSRSPGFLEKNAIPLLLERFSHTFFGKRSAAWFL